MPGVRATVFAVDYTGGTAARAGLLSIDAVGSIWGDAADS
jgi:hypothetical protein